MRRSVLSGLLFFTGLLGANAQLVFDQEILPLTVITGANPIKTEFAFRNTGHYPVTILRVRSSCDCVTASIEKKTIAPGDTGKINVSIRVGNRPSTSLTTLNFSTDDPHSNTILRVSLEVEGKDSRSDTLMTPAANHEGNQPR